MSETICEPLPYPLGHGDFVRGEEYSDVPINFLKFLAEMTTRGKILKKYLSHHLSKSKNEIQKKPQKQPK